MAPRRIACVSLAVLALTAAGVLAFAPAGGSRPGLRAGAPRLTDSFAMKFTVEKEHNGIFRTGAHVSGLEWLFAPDCDQGPCAVEISSTPNSCASGRCVQWPLGYLWSEEPLAFSNGRWHGAFTVKQGCTTASFSSPYAYEQRTTVQLHVTRTRTFGPGETQASAIAGTMTLSGKADPAEGRAGCFPYSLTFAVTGTSVA